MKVVILAGGLGTRLSEETTTKPKPMVEIGGKPIIWHIMKTYSHYGFNEFIICLGYKGYLIKEFFKNYMLHTSDVTLNLNDNSIIEHTNKSEKWKISLIDTGEKSMTGGRIKRIKKYTDNQPFFLTYGDGVSNININEELNFHNANKKICTITAVQPPGRFGSLDIKNNMVNKFIEKPIGDNSWINGGFFICEQDVFKYIKNDNTVFEQQPLKDLSNDNQLIAYKHNGFWKPMDTLRDKNDLNQLYDSGNAPWKVW
jgi:glucose-1-phosphate cytidylyltransferase